MVIIILNGKGFEKKVEVCIFWQILILVFTYEFGKRKKSRDKKNTNILKIYNLK